MIFEIYKDKAGQYRWRAKSRNGLILSHPEGYKTKRGAMAFPNKIISMILDGRTDAVKIKDLTIKK